MRRFAIIAGLGAVACGPIAAPLDDESSTDDEIDAGDLHDDLAQICPGTGIPEPPPSLQIDCEDYLSDALDEDAPTLDVEIVNLTAHAILVPNMIQGCHHDARYFDVRGTVGGRTAATPQSACPGDWPVCDHYVGREDEGCLLCGTLHPAQRIERGGRLRTQWHPYLMIEATAPAACTGTEDVACHVGMYPSAGDYIVSALAATEMDCPFACLEGDPLDADGSCKANDGGAECSFDLEAATSWNGSCARISIVFGDDPR